MPRAPPNPPPPRQEQLSRQRQPRDPHPHERRHRHVADTRRNRPGRDPARIRRRHPRQRQALLSLINDVLDLSKIEAGRLDLEAVAFDLRDVIYETVAVLALQSAVEGLELIVDIGDIPVIVRGDPGRLRQVVLNLVGNAIKFTHEGYILLTASVVSGPDGLPKLKIEVTDTGIGIPTTVSTACSRASRRSTPPPPATTAAPGSDCPSSSGSPSS